MKVKVIRIVSLLLLSSFLLIACGKNQSKDTSQSSEKTELKTSKSTSSSSKSKNKEKTSESESATEADQSSTEKDSNASQESTNEESSDVSSTIDLNALLNGDNTSIADTWENDLGEWVTITPNGQVYTNKTDLEYAIQSDRIDQVFWGTIYNPESEYGSAAFIVVPAGVANPHFGDTSDKDRILIGQDINADYHPYFRKEQ